MNPLISLPAEDADKLSDYIPGSNEASRVVSRQVSESAPVSHNESEEEAEPSEAEEEDDEDPDVGEDGDVVMAKTPSALKKEGAAKLKKQAGEDRKSAKNDREDGFANRRATQASLKSADSIKRFSYLLGQTDLFRHFCDLKAERDPEFRAMLEESEKALTTAKTTKKGKEATSRGRKSEKAEDKELLEAENHGEEDSDGLYVFTESPPFVKGGQMRDYQVQGLNWMVSLHHNGINGILADEMGLGKTLQTISFLGYLKFQRGVTGPHLVIVPKSTLDNWYREFEKWVPGFNVVMLRGSKEERAVVVNEKILTQDFDVLITSYELCLREKSSLKKLAWEYIIIDEAHRIKNVDSMLSQIVRVFDSRARLLITGTPLQNNLHELWALLNFLLPDVFSDVSDFDKWFERQSPAEGVTETAEEKEAASNSVVKQLHAVLRPFLLRRVKADVEKSLLPKKEVNVYVGMTPMQRKWYKSILEKDIDAVNGSGGKKEGKNRLQNIVMQLRKCCNHPYLFDGAEPGPPFTNDEHIVENSGKMLVLDKLLSSMKAKGSRVLIFSQMSRVLDILEDYCLFREYKYCRLDGSTAHDDRMAAIDAYNKPDSEKFIFLLTTRAGGLGINLTSADIVVLYDSDWNPQADLQAMDRAHRIGQKKQVYVFRFVTEHAVEEKVLERAAQKLRLDQLVIQQGRAQSNSKTQSKDELVDMVRHGAEAIINDTSTEALEIQDDIDEIIRRGEARTQELNSKYDKLNFDDLQIFKSETTTNWEGAEYGGGKKKGKIAWIEPSKRARKQDYSVDGYYRDTMRGGTGKPRAPRQPKGTKPPLVEDWKFFPDRLSDIQIMEQLYAMKVAGTVIEIENDDTILPEDLEADRQQQQDAIDNAEPLTEEEKAEKEALIAEGFPNWNKRDYQAFIRGCENHGRADLENIHKYELPGKSLQDVQRYSEVFWQRHKEVDDWERQLKKIEEAEAGREKHERQHRLVKKKVASVSDPLHLLKIAYANQTKGKSYSEEEDRFLLVKLAQYGTSSPDVYDYIKRDILAFPAFRFDWFMKSRSPAEIGRRCTTLLSLVEKEEEDESTEKPEKKKPAPKATAAAKAANGEGKAAGKGKRKEPASANTSRASTPVGGPTKKARK
ncbi:hypothetical protein P7C70_g3988, partial [Phenoliferia sp. Uapishka_3]